VRRLQDVVAALDPGSDRNSALEGIRMGSAELRTATGSQSLDGSAAVPATPCAYHRDPDGAGDLMGRVRPCRRCRVACAGRRRAGQRARLQD
jgi:hypothetical protein